MKVIKQKVYKIEYNLDYSDIILVEADSMIEAIEVIKSYNPKLEDKNITSISSYCPVIKKLTKTVTVEL